MWMTHFFPCSLPSFKVTFHGNNNNNKHKSNKKTTPTTPSFTSEFIWLSTNRCFHSFANLFLKFFLSLSYFKYLMMMKMMMNCFCGLVDQQKAFSLISIRDRCQRSSPLRISDRPRTRFELAQLPKMAWLVETQARIKNVAWASSTEYQYLCKNNEDE